MTNDTDNDDHWLRVELLTETPDTDAARLAGLGALGVEVQDADTYMEGVEFPEIPEDVTRLVVFFDADRPVNELRRQVQQTCAGADVAAVAEYRDRSWETAWMQHFEALRLSERVAVGPPWDPPGQPDDGVALIIEPGMAFGTGSHATTRLCARILDEIIAAERIESMLDVGCGSAILSMAAAGLGVTRVMGIDVDSKAVDVARTNAEANGFDDEAIELSTRPLEQIDERFEVVVANILAPVLLELRRDLWDAVADGGHLVLSGIPLQRTDELREAFDRDDIDEVSAPARGDWRALHFRRQPR